MGVINPHIYGGMIDPPKKISNAVIYIGPGTKIDERAEFINCTFIVINRLNFPHARLMIKKAHNCILQAENGGYAEEFETGKITQLTIPTTGSVLCRTTMGKVWNVCTHCNFRFHCPLDLTFITDNVTKMVLVKDKVYLIYLRDTTVVDAYKAHQFAFCISKSYNARITDTSIYVPFTDFFVEETRKLRE